MEKNIIKERFEYIIGFVALVVSLGDFKDELQEIKIDFNIISFNLAQYFLAIILTAIIALHFYFLPQFFKGEKKVFEKVNKVFHTICYTILFFIVLTPFLTGLVYLFSLIDFNKKATPFLQELATLMAILATLSYAIKVALSRTKGMHLIPDNNILDSIPVEVLDKILAEAKAQKEREKNAKNK